MAQMIRRRRRLGPEAGAELVEFALVLPFLLLVVLGIAEFGIILQRYEVLVNAAREGARVAVLPGYTANDVSARVTQYLDSGRVPYTATNPTIVTTTPPALVIVNGASTTTIPLKRVTVTYTYAYMFLPKFARWGNASNFGFTSALTMTAVAEMRPEAGS